jgi:UDP-N-acetyl-D-glucosamine dehydrogenase
MLRDPRMSEQPSMRIAVIGLGKIGLPLSAQFADRGHQVVGVDVNVETVQTINSGVAPFPGEAHLDDHLQRLVAAGRLRATTEYAEAVPDADAVVVVVPLITDKQGTPDFGWMDQATRDLGRNLTSGTLVIYETTLPVGTTRERWKPALEEHSGLVEGVDFHVVFSPERVSSGRVFADLRRYPKLIGGLTPAGAAAAVDFYQATLEFDERPDLARTNGVWDLGSAEAAEMAKLAETTYRDVNIGLANQFAMFAERAGIDIYEVIEASNSQPYSHIHRPGVSVGGHCIPVYPRLYLAGDPEATVVSAAREANLQMPRHAVQTLESEYGDLEGARVAVLGAAYRRGVKETAFSGVFELVAELEARGAQVNVHDPLYTEAELHALGLTAHGLGAPLDAAIVHTDHACYSDLTLADLPGVRVVLDGRGLFPELGQGVVVRTLGKPSEGNRR